MTATWIVKIEVANLACKLANVTGVRTNGADVRTYTLQGVSVDLHDKPLATIKTQVTNALYAMYTADVAQVSAITTLLSGWEAALATALNGKEV